MRGNLFLTVLLTVYCWAYGFELSAFRIPTHSVYALVGDGGTDIHGGSFVDDDSHDRDWYRHGDIGGSGYWLYDSERLGIETAVQAGYSEAANGSKDRDRDGSSYYSFSKQNYLNQYESADAVVSGVYFPTQTAFSVQFSGSGSADIGQSHRESEWRRDSDTLRSNGESEMRTSSFRYYARGEAGLGWGRVRNASAVYDAYILEARLAEMGRLSGELSQETRQKLAELLYQRSAYEKRNERSARLFWRDVEAILKSDAAMTGELDAFALYRINEEVAPSTMARWSGWRLSMNIAGVHENDIYKTHSEWTRHEVTDTSSTDTSSVGSYSGRTHWEQMLFGPRVEVNIPLNWHVQLTGDMRLEHRVDPADDGFFWTTLLNGQYAVHDRWKLAYTFIHERWIHDPKDRNLHNGQMWNLYHSASLAYYIEDNIEASLSMSHYQSRAWDFVPNDGYSHYQRHSTSYSLRMGLSYIFSGSNPWYSSSRYIPRSGMRVSDLYYPRSYSQIQYYY